MKASNLEIFINERGPYLGRLTVETDRIDVTSLYDSHKPDRAWTFVDPAGHFHAYAADEKLPTLEPYAVHISCDGACGGYCEGYTERHHRCRACGAEVKPGYVVDVPACTPHSIPGRTSWAVAVAAREEPPAGMVSIRCASTGLAGRDWFGFAEGRINGVMSGPVGQFTYTYQAYGVTELGRRP